MLPGVKACVIADLYFYITVTRVGPKALLLDSLGA